jgi:hypothetical protein
LEVKHSERPGLEEFEDELDYELDQNSEQESNCAVSCTSLVLL